MKWSEFKEEVERQLEENGVSQDDELDTIDINFGFIDEIDVIQTLDFNQSTTAITIT